MFDYLIVDWMDSSLPLFGRSKYFAYTVPMYFIFAAMRSTAIALGNGTLATRWRPRDIVLFMFERDLQAFAKHNLGLCISWNMLHSVEYLDYLHSNSTPHVFLFNMDILQWNLLLQYKLEHMVSLIVMKFRVASTLMLYLI